MICSAIGTWAEGGGMAGWETARVVGADGRGLLVLAEQAAARARLSTPATAMSLRGVPVPAGHPGHPAATAPSSLAVDPRQAGLAVVSRAGPGGQPVHGDGNELTRSGGSRPRQPGWSRRRRAVRFPQVEFADGDLTHHELLHFSGHGHREVVGDPQVPGDLEVSDLPGAELPE